MPYKAQSSAKRKNAEPSARECTSRIFYGFPDFVMGLQTDAVNKRVKTQRSARAQIERVDVAWEQVEARRHFNKSTRQLNAAL
jgi:hypothetical protein